MTGAPAREDFGNSARAGKSLLGRYAAFLIDVDGVLTRGAEALPGAVEAFQSLRRCGRVLVLTNNSTRARSELATYLRGLGFDLTADDVLGSAFLAARFLLRRVGRSSVWVLGEDGIRQEMALCGHTLAETPEEADWVVVGMDRSLTYEKLAQALRALVRGARVLATNEDATFPTTRGLVPGAGALVGALRGMGFPPTHTVGKPSPVAFEEALALLGLPPERVLMIGDRLETDVAGAQAAGLDTALVLSGVCTAAEAGRAAIQPTWVAVTLLDLCSGRLLPLGENGTLGAARVGSRAR